MDGGLVMSGQVIELVLDFFFHDLFLGLGPEITRVGLRRAGTAARLVPAFAIWRMPPHGWNRRCACERAETEFRR